MILLPDPIRSDPIRETRAPFEMFESNSGGGTHCSLVLFAPKDKRRSDPYSYNLSRCSRTDGQPFFVVFCSLPIRSLI